MLAPAFLTNLVYVYAVFVPSVFALNTASFTVPCFTTSVHVPAGAVPAIAVKSEDENDKFLDITNTPPDTSAYVGIVSNALVLYAAGVVQPIARDTISPG